MNRLIFLKEQVKKFGKDAAAKAAAKVISKKKGVSNVIEIILILVVVVALIVIFKAGAGEIISQGIGAVKNSITTMLGTP